MERKTKKGLKLRAQTRGLERGVDVGSERGEEQ
jgi:hypothetical protein